MNGSAEATSIRDGGLQVTYDDLNVIGACGDGLRKFRKHFPETSVVITEELCVKHARDFDWHWAATELLSIELGNVWRQFHDTMRHTLLQAEEFFNTLEETWNRVSESMVEAERGGTHTTNTHAYGELANAMGHMAPEVTQAMSRVIDVCCARFFARLARKQSELHSLRTPATSATDAATTETDGVPARINKPA